MFLMFCLNSMMAQQPEEDKTLSPYFVVISENPEVDNLPLKETSVKADIVGVIADVTVKQVYVNSGENTLEAIYTFPLSTKAAVYGMQMTIGTRILTAKIEEKEKARKDYEEAKSEGKRASLLEQSRPNVFTMNVSNIVAGDTIIVELKYTELMIPEKGKYSFVYPTVVGPRYSNKNNKNSEVDDDFVATPYTKSGEAPSYKFDFEVNINSGIPIQNVVCNTHKMIITNPNLNKSIVKLDPTETKGGNKDVILNYSLQGNKIESGIMLYESGDENFFLMMIQPPKKVLKEDIPPREYVFIVDVSGSMRGFPLEISKKLLRNLIVNLNPDDKFNVMLFSMNTGLFSPSAVSATSENVEKATEYIDQHNGGGNTELLQALEQAYKLPRPNVDLSRTFVIITDGYVDVEREALEMIRKNGDNTNVFSFGIGSSVNRYLIEGMAFMGNGEPLIVTEEKGAEEQADAFRSYINTPVLTRIKMNYGAFKTYDIEPIAVPDMLAERPIIIFGKYKGRATGTISLSGKVGRKNYKRSFDLSKIKPSKNNSAIRYLWARERIKLLDYLIADKSNEDDVKTITELGLKYNLMTNYTSFIAIDEQIVEKDGKLIKVKQPIPMPEGVSDYAIGYGMGTISGGVDIADLQDHKIVVVEERKPEIFNFVEVMPVFPGGEKEMMRFITNNLNFSDGMPSNETRGKIVVRFVVEADGSVSNIEILKGLSELYNQAVLDMMKKMPKWIPGRQNGMTVRTFFILPIGVHLQ